MRVAALALLALPLLAACSTPDRLAVLENLKGCDRHYEGVVMTSSFGTPGLSGKVTIDCKAQTVTP
jgi:hypothetical protein